MLGDSVIAKPKGLDATQLMGLAGLLRAWRASAGQRLGLRKPLSQEEVCSVLGRSVRWYRDLENGAQPKLERDLLDKLADALMLGRDERLALHYHALGGTLHSSEANDPTPTHTHLQLMLDQLMPRPAYVRDSLWNIVSYNQTMADWWPWVTEPEPNLMSWALLSKEARFQFVDWPFYARAFLALLRFAGAERPADHQLTRLITRVLDDPDCHQLWLTHHDVSSSRDGHYSRLRLPIHDFEEIEIITHSMRPDGLPDHRLVVHTWVRDDKDPVPEQHQMNRPTERKRSMNMQTTHADTAVTVGSESEARALAGKKSIPLPKLSHVAGNRYSLTLSPEKGSVLWATEQVDGSWSVSELSAYTVLVQLPHASAAVEARDEYKQLVRASLPTDQPEALSQLDTLITQHHQRLEVLREIRTDLRHGGKIDTAWHPVNEI